MGLLLDKIPGLTKAVARANRLADERRDLAMSGCDVRLCGIEVRQLTARHIMHLFAARSPFFYGGIPQPWQVAQFFLIVRPDAGAYIPREGDVFMRRIARLAHGRAVRAIDRFIEDAIIDRPAHGPLQRDAIAGTFAGIVHEIAAAYGWSRDTILDSPIAEIYQYFRLIEQAANPRAVFFNPADKARLAAFKKWKARRAHAKGGNARG